MTNMSSPNIIISSSPNFNTQFSGSENENKCFFLFEILLILCEWDPPQIFVFYTLLVYIRLTETPNMTYTVITNPPSPTVDLTVRT